MKIKNYFYFLTNFQAQYNNKQTNEKESKLTAIPIEFPFLNSLVRNFS